MNSEIRRLRIQTYREQLIACNQVRVALSREIKNRALPWDELGPIDHRLDRAINESASLQVMLGYLVQEENEDQIGQQFEVR
jgi:hypothetical protein